MTTRAKKCLKMTSVRCKHCVGSGKTIAYDGRSMRAMRKDADVSLRTMATRMKISAPYLSDMELGRRRITHDMAQRFLREVES